MLSARALLRKVLETLGLDLAKEKRTQGLVLRDCAFCAALSKEVPLHALLILHFTMDTED